LATISTTASLTGCAEQSLIVARPGETMVLTHEVRARVGVRNAEGQWVNRWTTIPPGFWIVPDPDWIADPD